MKWLESWLWGRAVWLHTRANHLCDWFADRAYRQARKEADGTETDNLGGKR